MKPLTIPEAIFYLFAGGILTLAITAFIVFLMAITM